MQLLFKRSQGRTGMGRPNFKLWAKVEMDEETHKLLSHYFLFSAILIEVDQPSLYRHSVIVGVVSFFLFYLIIAFNFWYALGLGMTGVVAVSALIGAGAAYVYYHQNRDTIYLSDLAIGRYFKCRSVVDLARKEQWLKKVVAYLRQVAESAKHWGGTETVDVPALPKDEAMRVIVKG